MEELNITVQQIISIVQVNLVKKTYPRINRSCSVLCIKAIGSSIYHTNGGDCLSDSSHVVLIPRGSSYTYTIQEEGPCFLMDFNATGLPDHICSYPVANVEKVLEAASEAEKFWSTKRTGYRERCFSAFYQIFYQILISSLQNADPRRNRIRNSMSYLSEHYCDHDLNMNDVASCSNISEVYFRRLFTETMELSPKRYVTMLRMNKACSLLKMEEFSIGQIAEFTGFGDVYTFCKAFRKEMGMTPTEYRNTVTKRES